MGAMGGGGGGGNNNAYLWLFMFKDHRHIFTNKHTPETSGSAKNQEANYLYIVYRLAFDLLNSALNF